MLTGRTADLLADVPTPPGLRLTTALEGGLMLAAIPAVVALGAALLRGFDATIESARALNAGNAVQQEMVVMVHVRYHHLQHVIGVLAGNKVALLHLRVLGNLLFKRRETLGCMPIHANQDDRRQRKAKFLVVQNGDGSDDDTGILQCPHTTETGRRG